MEDSSSLEWPHVRRDLILYLDELAADDPRRIWEEKRGKGHSSDIDEVFHFFFDDHDFGEDAVGVFLFDASEAAMVETVRRALEGVHEDIGDQADDEFVQHPLWPTVTRAACKARAKLSLASGRPLSTHCGH